VAIYLLIWKRSYKKNDKETVIQPQLHRVRLCKALVLYCVIEME